MKTKTFDETFDAGEDVTRQVDWGRAKRPNITPKRVNVDFPTWMVEGLDHEAERLGITRQALIKTWIADRLKA